MKQLSKLHREKQSFNWQIGSVILLFIFGIAEISLFIYSFFFSPETPPQIQQQNLNKSNFLENQARSITIKIIAKDYWGSGIIIAKKNHIYRILTNDHVVSKNIKNYLINTPDGKIHDGKVVASASDFEGNDLAILDFESKDRDYNIAKFGQLPKVGDEVFASGFPSPLLGEKNKGLVFRKGVIWKLLDKPLKEGYQLGYTNEIEKGMSGGALFNRQGQVVAINGIHAYPLLGKPYVYEDGTVPNGALIEEMVHHSFGIPSNAIPLWVFNKDRNF